jgi:hypothetical protein
MHHHHADEWIVNAASWTWGARVIRQAWLCTGVLAVLDVIARRGGRGGFLLKPVIITNSRSNNV